MVYLLKYQSNDAGSSKGRTWDFESQYLGSNPSPAAKVPPQIRTPDFDIINTLCQYGKELGK